MQEKQVLIQTKMVQRRRGVKQSYALSSSIFSFIFFLSFSPAELLTDEGVNFEVLALLEIKSSLIDPHGVLMNWDGTAVDPCSWNIITCSFDNVVVSIGAPDQNLSGTLASSIGNLTYLQTVLLQNNYITGHIPPEFGKLKKLKTLDLSANDLTGQIPSTLSHSTNLQQLRLNNNNLTGTVPSSLANMNRLFFLYILARLFSFYFSSSTYICFYISLFTFFRDLSYNNLSGPVPKPLAKIYNVTGNPQICPTGTEEDCKGSQPMATSPTLNSSQNEASDGGTKKKRFAVDFSLSLTFVCLLIIGFGFY